MKQEKMLGLVGLLLIGLGAWFLNVEMREPEPHTNHVYTFTGIMVLGAGMIAPAFMLSVLRLVTDKLPTWGTRKGDLPIEAAPPGTIPGEPAGKVVIAKPDPEPGDA